MSGTANDAPEPRARHRRCPKCQSRYPEATAFCPTDGSSLDLANGSLDDRTGDVIGERYRLVRLLGQGGMGQVYEASHVNIDKRVAVKMLRREVVAANPEAIARFRQEARAASSIGHPSIVEIEDFADLPDGGVYLAMELLRGESLADHLRKQGTLSVDESVRILVQVARGLQAAHAIGIVHRDIKPDNLFLCAREDEPPRVKILDFGIAKVTSGDAPSTMTQTGAVFGTPHYMSPEQALGRSVDARSDIYSLGVIAYELLAGELPFQSESLLGVLNQHVQTPPPAFSPEVAARIPEALAQAVMHALAKDPADRPSSMEELSAALVGVQARRRDATPAVRVAGDLPAIPALGASVTLDRAPPTQPLSRARVIVVRSSSLACSSASPRSGAPRTWCAGRHLSSHRCKSPCHPRSFSARRSSRRRSPGSRARRHVTRTRSSIPTRPCTPTRSRSPNAPPRPDKKVAAPAAAELDRLATSLAPGMHRQGEITMAKGERSGDRTDVYVQLAGGSCYTFVGRSQAGIEGLSLYLWDPAEKRITERRDRNTTPSLVYCATATGRYHVQAKINAGSAGLYEVATYVR